MVVVGRLIYLIYLFGVFSEGYGYSVSKELKDIKRAEKKINKLIEYFNQQNLSIGAVRFLDGRGANLIKSWSIKDSGFVIHSIPPYEDRINVVHCSFERISGYDIDDLYVTANKNMRIYFNSLSDLVTFKILVARISNFKMFQKSCFSKIFAGSLLKNNNNFEPSEKTIKNISPTLKKMFSDVRLSFLKKRIDVLFSCYLKRHSVYNSREDSAASDSSFDNLARTFFNYVKIEPNLIQYMDLEILVSFLKQVAFSSAHLEDISEMYSHFFVDYARELLLLIKSISLKNGNNIKTFYYEKKIRKEQFFSLLRRESDLMWLSVARNQAKQSKIDEQKFLSIEKEKNKPIIMDLYNFKEILKVSQVHIFLLLELYKKGRADGWKRNLNQVLDETHNKENLRNRVDFSFPYGRWAQAGQALRGHIDISDYCEKNNLNSSLRVSAINFSKKLFNSNEIYLNVINKLSLKVNKKKMSFLDILGLINVKDLARL